MKTISARKKEERQGDRGNYWSSTGFLQTEVFWDGMTCHWVSRSRPAVQSPYLNLQSHAVQFVSECVTLNMTLLIRYTEKCLSLLSKMPQRHLPEDASPTRRRVTYQKTVSPTKRCVSYQKTCLLPEDMSSITCLEEKTRTKFLQFNKAKVRTCN